VTSKLLEDLERGLERARQAKPDRWWECQLVDPETFETMRANGYICVRCRRIIDEDMPGHPRDCGFHLDIVIKASPPDSPDSPEASPGSEPKP
jgi:hypothetical protein